MAKEIIWSQTAEDEKNDILRFWLMHNQSPIYSFKLTRQLNCCLIIPLSAEKLT